MGLWERCAELSLTIEDARLDPLELFVDPFLRLTTEVVLLGGGAEGRGEEVSYGQDDQRAFRAAPLPELGGTWTLSSFSAHLATQDLWAEPPSQEAYRDYRLWAFESAALDLALRQNDLVLANLLEREPRPVRFCASMGLGEPPDLGRIEALHARVPGLELKLDAAPSWDEALLESLAATGLVRVIDFKGAYVGTPVDQPVDLALYERVLRLLPDACIEDPHTAPEVLALLEPEHHRIAWDAPIHSVEDCLAMPIRSPHLNVKPSRLGTLERLSALYEHAAEEGLQLYGGGQFELGVGRLHIQHLASLFHPEGPNDVAPASYHKLSVATELPTSPLASRAAEPGLG